MLRMSDVFVTSHNGMAAPEKSRQEAAPDSLKFAAGNRLFETDASCGDVSSEIALTQDRGAGETAEHGDLADMIEGVGDRALEESFRRSVKQFGSGQMVVKLFHGRKKSFDFGVPCQRRGVVPGLFALRDRKGPVEEVAHVRQDLRRRTRLVSDVEAGKVIWGAA